MNEGSKVVLRREAAADLRRISAWLATLTYGDPQKMREKIGAAITVLKRHGDMGRPGRRPGTRELSVAKSHYVIVYRAHAKTIEILAVFHTAQNR